MLALAVWTVEAILQLASPSDPQIRPDGRAFAYVYRGEVFTAPLPQAGKGQSVAKASRPRWSPNSRLLAFLSEGQVHLLDVATGGIRRVSNSETAVSAYQWLPDGSGIVYLAPDPGPPADPIIMDRDYRYSRLYLQELAAESPRRITDGQRHVVSFALSPSGKQIVYAAQPTPSNRDAFNVDLYRRDLDGGVETPLVSQPGRDADPSFSPDGRFIAFHSQAGSRNYFEARHVAIVPSDGGDIRYITRNHPAFDVFRGGMVTAWSPDSSSVIYTAGRGATDILISHHLPADQPEILTERITGPPSCVPDLSSCVYLKTSRTHPPEVFHRSGRTERQITHYQEAVAGYPQIRSEVVRWTSSDGTAVEGVLWLPFDYREGRRVPLLTELHGGPTGVSLDAFPLSRIYPIPVLLQHGFAVFSPNFRGSVNYGAKFRLKNALSQGIGDYDDVVTGIDALIKRGVADPERLGIMGWSYGGYLTGSVLTQTRRFKAASIGAPATDWFTYYGQSDAAPEVLATYFGGSPWDVPEEYDRHSSRAGLKNIRTPALLQVGSVDINHNGEIYRALMDHNVPVEYVIYPREGHSISEPAHVRDVLERNLHWFLRWIPSRGAALNPKSIH